MPLEPACNRAIAIPLFRASRSSRPRDLRALADEDLMELVCDGDGHAFEVVFDRHAGPAYSLAYRICGSQARAEDVVQEALLSLWRNAGRYRRGRGSVRTWVLSVTHNRAIDTLRREASSAGRDVAAEDAAARLPAAERTDSEVERRDDARRVRSALHELPSDQRQVIELAYFGGFTHSEIAAMLELPSGTVKGRMRLGMAKMRISLGDPARVVL